MEVEKTKKLRKKKLTKHEKLIEKFMATLDFPDWFRGLSQVQMDAADSLLNCIRDDSEQGTSHRVRYALITLGIEPLVSSAKIKHAMRLSRGNDMAFLWFLMELYYRHTCDQCEHKTVGYTVNEQLIMTTVAHLDTIPTLRELDRLLPKQPKQAKPKRIRPKRVVKPSGVLPYFETQPRPVSYGKSLTLNELLCTDNLGQYDQYLDPNYVAPNECNRWFASYKLCENERIASRIIKEEIDGVFKKEDAGLLGDQNDTLLCQHHITMKAMIEKMENELKVEKKKAFEKYFDLDGELKHKSYKRVVQQLNAEIEEAEETIRKITEDKDRAEKILTGTTLENETPETEWRPQSFYRTCGSIAPKHGFSLDFGHASTATDTTKYFKATSRHQPYQFNYNKIFDLGPRDPVKEAVATALNAGDSGDAISLNHSRAIQKCCQEIWTSEVERYKAEYAAKKKAEEEDEKRMKNFNLPYYDPRDNDLMNKMLSEALKEMRKNKKFILASLPNAYKFRILKVWIMKRYGMVYTRKEKRELYESSKKIFTALSKNPIKIRIPMVTDLSANRIVSYGCQAHLLQKTNYLKERYYHNFKTALLDYTRTFWGAIRPYQCSKGPPRNEFFSYMPARETDVHMFRPWKVTEYIPAKEAWDRKQTLKRNKRLY